MRDTYLGSEAYHIAWLRGLVPILGYEVWPRGLVTRLGYEAWLRGLVTRSGPEAWSRGLVTRLGYEVWSRGLVTRCVTYLGYKALFRGLVPSHNHITFGSNVYSHSLVPRLGSEVYHISWFRGVSHILVPRCITYLGPKVYHISWSQGLVPRLCSNVKECNIVLL